MMLVTIEGITGTGKTTLVENLKPLLTTPIYTAEPYGIMEKNINNTTGGIYKIAIYSLLSHIEHLERLIEPKKENIIISDCFFDKFIATQSLVQQLDIIKLIEYQKKISVIPDLTILLICDPKIAYQRSSNQQEFDNIDFLNDVQDNFLLLAKMRKNVFIIDTTTMQPELVTMYANNMIKTYYHVGKNSDVSKME